ncbi:patatin-like phospholipase family protein [Ferrovibrio terrae]|uniref:patatin-like phospholipase family protein n=1 Tax=Ferrovibrio terrae TaxID=2594003 RepID=UPI003137AD47
MKKKSLKLALQGGGAHGAFTWGVLDRLLEDDRIEIEALVGTSAGAMNAAVTAYGLGAGGPAKAKALLEAFWRKSSEAGKKGPLQPSPIDKLFSIGNMDYSPMYHFFNSLSQMMSPYQLNPTNVNPLRDLIAEVVDFEALRANKTAAKLFICATNVKNGRIRVFNRDEVTPDAVMASACLPFLFQAVEVDGNFYWDGGYCGNPPIFPLIYEKGTNDILIVQINPINIPEVPNTAAAILDRINTLSWNSSLMREMRAIQFVTNLLDTEELNREKYPRVFMHSIDAEDVLAKFSVSSKLNPDWEFLCYLRDLGRERAEAFLAAHFDDIGKASTTDIVAKFM